MSDRDSSGLFGDESRRSFLLKSALTSGGLAMTANGAAASDGGSEEEDAPCILEATEKDYDYEDIDLNEADVEFIQTMISHHWGALILASLVPDRSNQESLVNLSKHILNAQYTQIQRMQQMLLDSGVDYVVDEVPSDSEIPGMPTNGGMATLRVIQGERFNAAWINIMSAHHRGGIILGRRVLEEGESEALRNLAKKMIRAQERQIYHMYRNYVDWMEPPSEEPFPEETGDEDDENVEDE